MRMPLNHRTSPTAISPEKRLMIAVMQAAMNQRAGRPRQAAISNGRMAMRASAFMAHQV